MRSSNRRVSPQSKTAILKDFDDPNHIVAQAVEHSAQPRIFLST
jgi:hypothetical protein